jgi:hypothetical protein
MIFELFFDLLSFHDADVHNSSLRSSSILTSLKARLQKLLNEVENLAVLFLLHLPRLPSIPLVLLPLR